MPHFAVKSGLLAVMTFAALMTLSACSDQADSVSKLAPPEESGILKVVTRNGSTTYYLNRNDQPVGPEYDLVSAYAADRGWTVEWQMLDSTAAVLEALDSGQAHLAAAGLTLLDSRSQRFERGPAHTEITQQLVCNRKDRPLPRALDELDRVQIRVTADSSYAETLSALANAHPGLTFDQDERSTEVLLGEVAQGKLDCTMADSNIVQINRRYMHDLEIALNLTKGQNLGWYLPKGSEKLAGDARRWMNGDSGDAAIGRMEERYYAYIGKFDYVDVRTLNRRIDDRLPDYKDQFLTAEQNTGMPADLLAALSYQESHWNPSAKSPTGVRGIMMLTKSTAAALGVKDRLDPTQAIEAGSRYLADRHDRLPDTIPEPDRTYLALASYNVGRAHLLDARQLARDLGKDPDSWKDMSEVLPLLSDKRYYPKLRHGYARGYEPVQYVTRIRNYRDIIEPAFDQ